MLRAGVEVVVVGREPSLRQSLSLHVSEHARGHAGLEAKLPYTTHHGQHRFECRPLTYLTPGPSHTKAIRTGLGGHTGPVQNRPHLKIRLTGDITAVMHRLRAVRTVLLAASGLDAEQ